MILGMRNHTKKPRSRSNSNYRVRNWAAYDKALVQRGSLTFWLSDDFAQSWQAAATHQRGAQRTYSDQAIQLVLTLKEVFHLTNRAVEGLTRSLFTLLKLAVSVPDHSTLSRRGTDLPIQLPKQQRGPMDLVMDSTGLKVYGEGEWKVRLHGKSKRRTWRKLHLAVDPASGEIQVARLTANSCSDDEAAVGMIAQVDQPLKRFAADGGYDKRKVYDALRAQAPAAQVLIPPRKNARIWQHGNSRAERLARDENVRAIRRQGRTAWKQATGYHIRSLSETAMYRMKTIFGDKLSTRLLETQRTQALVRCAALNQMTHLGMPQSYTVG